MKLKAFNLLLLLIFINVAYSQNKLSGYIYDTNNEAIIEAEVYLTPSQKLETSKDDGSFLFKDIKEGEYTIIIFAFGYAIKERNIRVDKEATTINLVLDELGGELSEVVLTQQRKKLFNLRKLKSIEGTFIYDSKKNEVVLVDKITGNLAANNARQIYGQVVGLNIYDNGDAGLQLNIGGRGLDPNRTASFNTRQNGYDISADVLGYPESYYTPPAEALSEIQVIRGAASLQFGTQFGGLLNFVFKKPTLKKPIEWTSRQTTGSFGLLTSFNSLSGTLGKFSYYTYFNYKEGNSFRPNSSFNSRNYFGSFGYQFNAKTKLTFETTLHNYLAQQPGGITDAQFLEDPSFSNRTRNWFDVNWKLFNIKLEHKVSNKTDFSLSLFSLDASRSALGIRDNRVTTEDDLERPRELLIDNFLNWGAEARWLTRYKIKEKEAVFLIGSKYYQSDNDQAQGPGISGSAPDFQFGLNEFPGFERQASFQTPNLNIALFGENIFNLTKVWKLVPGFRVEHIKTKTEGEFRNIVSDLAGNILSNTAVLANKSFTRNFILLGLGSTYTFNNGMELYGNISENYRSVTFSDILIDNVSFIVDPNITDEEGFSSDIGIRGRYRNKLSYDVNIFGLAYKNRLGERAGRQGDNSVRIRTNIGDAFIYGLESFVDWNIKDTFFSKAKNLSLNLFANLAITQSEYISETTLKTPEVIPPAGPFQQNGVVVGNKVEFIPTINLKTGTGITYKNFTASAQYTFLSSQFTDASNTEANIINNDRGIEGEIPSYGVLDFSTSYTYKNWKLETGVNNLLNERFFVRRATGYPGPGIIPSEPRAFYTTLQVKL